MQYTYRPLDHLSRQIRLLHLHPGHKGSDIRASLEAINFDDASLPSYEALSYTWGAPGHHQYVRIDGATLSTSINLAQALHHLRLEDRSRVIWIDAICINQIDMEGKSRQVAMFPDIYSRASTVTAWVGPASADSHIAVERMRVASRSKFQPSRSFLPNGLRRPPFGEMQMIAITSLLQRDYFERMWVWQETRLGHPRAVLLCGSCSFPWPRFGQFIIYLLRNQRVRYPGTEGLGQRLQNLRQLCISADQNAEMVSSVNTLHCSRWCQCLDQRDRIFATNSLTSKHSLRVVPDYDRPIEEVYTEFSARNLHHDDGKINLLSYHSKPNNLDNLASWVVDWTTPKRTAQELRGRASLDWDPPGREIEYGILHVYAVAGASIFGLAETDQFTDSALTEPKRGPKLGQMLRTFVSAAKRTGCIAHDNEEIVYALHRVLLAGEYAEAVSPPRPDYPSLRTGQRFLERMLNPEPDGEKPSVNDSVTILATIKERCQGRKLCITSNGAFGLVPSYAEPGDQIAVVLGCNNAIVLRDKGPDYELVGDAWLDGFMDGEALLGPVPPRYQVLNDRQHPMVLRPLFLDLETREITLQDPRKLIPRAPPKVVRIRIV